MTVVARHFPGPGFGRVIRLEGRRYWQAIEETPRMKLGFSLPVSGARATPQNQIRIARHAEALGHHSVWVLQRLLYPI